MPLALKEATHKGRMIFDELPSNRFWYALLRNIPPLPKVGLDLPSLWYFGPRKGLVPGREPWSQEVFNLYETRQIKSEKVSDVPSGPCAW
jgi:hypothetical protein